MKAFKMSHFEKSGLQTSRRGFMLRTATLVASAAASSVFAPLAARSAVGPNAADLEIATLGDWLRAAEPDSAAQLDAEAREATGLTTTQSIDWPTAQRARVLLTEDVLIAAELARGDIVFVDGWLLTRSEAGAALLYAAARAQMQSSLQAGLAG